MKDTKRWLLFLLILCLFSGIYLEFDDIWETIIRHYKVFIIGAFILGLITALGIAILFIVRKKNRDNKDKIQYLQSIEGNSNIDCRIDPKTSNDEFLLLIHKYETMKEKDNKKDNQNENK